MVTAWARRAPWPTETQIEQDLILSRLIVEIANDEVLGPELAFRGGTCLHKLHLPQPLRYSEDLDYVRRTSSGIGPYLDALREVATGIGLEEHGREFSDLMAHMVFDAEPTSGQGRIRIKIETNTREADSFEERVTRPHAVDSQWWKGQAEVSTFSVEELMATKLRALYQRRKGRDLYDLWHVFEELGPDPQRIVAGLRHYMGKEVFSYHELADNLGEKLKHPDFRDDLTGLVREVPSGYELARAADLTMELLGSRLDGAPAIETIKDGAWRNR